MIFQVFLWIIVIAVIIHLLITDRANSRHWDNWIPALFFLSGFPALVYQIVWQRALFVVFGSNVQSVTAIVTIFIAGLGLGSLLSGWFSERVKSPLRIFALLELSVGIFGAASIPVLHAVSAHTASLSTLGTTVVVALVVFPPTMFMGATLPMLVSHISTRDPVVVGRSVGRLYFVNTLGSAIACFICAQFAMQSLGQRGMTLFAAGVNVVIGSFILFRKRKTWEERKEGLGRPSNLMSRPLIKMGSALLLAFLTGFIALAYEVIWYRVYSFADGGRANGFAYVLGAYLAGLAYGALVAEAKCRQAEESGKTIGIAVVGILVIAFNILAFLLAPVLGLAVRVLGGGASAVLLLVAVAAGCLGSIFPLIANVVIRPGRGAGKGLGELYFTNMVGAASGSFLVGYLLFDYLPLRNISLLLVLAGLACGAFLAATAGKLKSLASGAILALSVTAVSPILFDHLYEKLLLKSDYRSGMNFVHVIENKSGVIAVTENGTVFGGGVFDGVFNTGLVSDTNNIVRCFAISSFHPSPRTVLAIGLSSGSWAQVLANHPQVEKLDVVEINPGYLRLIPEYSQVASLLHNPKVRIEIDDGRRWLRRNPQERYDLIVMNTTYHWRANTTNLLSSEFLNLVRQHLNNGGILYYNTTSSGRAQFTGATVFPYALRVGNFLAVSDSPISLNRQRLRTTLLEYKIDGKAVVDASKEEDRRRLDDIVAKVEPVTYGEDRSFFSFEFGDSIRRRYAGAKIMTDDNMGDEWAY